MAETGLNIVKITRRSDEPVIYVPRRCEFTRIIVSLTRNHNQWLTSVGWRREEKNIALKCNNTDDGLAVFLPQKFAKEISPDDVIAISCVELGFEGEMRWGGASPAVSLTEKKLQDGVLVPQPHGAAVPITNGGGRSKAILLGGISALVIVGLVGVSFWRGNLNQTNKTVAIANANSAVQTKSTETNVGTLELLDTQSSGEKPSDTEQAVIAETEVKQNEDAQLAAKTMRDKKEATARILEKERLDAVRAEKIADIAAVKTAKAKAAKAAKAAEAAKADAREAKRNSEEKAKADALEVKRRVEANILKEKALKLKLKEAAVSEVEPIIAKPDNAVSAVVQPKLATKPVNVPKLTQAQGKLTVSEITQLQNDLNFMGYAAGQVDGVLSEQTLSSVLTFKSIFKIAEDAPTDRVFLNEVRKQSRIYKNRKPAPRVLTAVAPSTVVATAPTEALQSETAVSAVNKQVSRKLIIRPALNYPERPNSRPSFTAAVSVVVSYGIDASGSPVDVTVVSNSHTGWFASDFKNEAVKVAKRQTFEPIQAPGENFDPGSYQTTFVFKK